MNLFVYGSLKRGFFNHDRFNFGNYAKFIGTGEVKDVSLVRMGNLPYPHAFKNKGGTVKGELFEVVRHPRMMEMIDDMERGAGYVPHQVVVNGLEATMYVAADYLTPQLKGGEVMSEWTQNL